MKVLFLALAKHQNLYFNKLLEQPGMQGKVVTPGQMPWPALGALCRVIPRINWPVLVEEKCQERRVKGKYEGWLYRLLLRLEMLVVALRAEALLVRECPDAVGVWNGSSRHCQLLLALLPAGTKTFYFENGLLPGTTTLDAKGVNYRNSVPRSAAFYRAYAERVQVETGGDLIQLIPRKPRSAGPAPIKLPERYIFIPFQDDRDTQVRLFSPWVGDMRELFALGERLVAETGLTIVFKEHPSSRESYPDLHRRTHERLLFANGNPTQELIQASQFVVTLNSTVGLESLLLGKPLLTLGQAFFNIPGLVMHADSVEELLTIARAFPEWPLEVLVRESFLRYMAAEYCVQGSWQNADQAHLDLVVARMLRRQS